MSAPRLPSQPCVATVEVQGEHQSDIAATRPRQRQDNAGRVRTPNGGHGTAHCEKMDALFGNPMATLPKKKAARIAANHYNKRLWARSSVG